MNLEADDPGAGEQRAEARLHSQLPAVAAVTIANGGDNLGIYIALFATNIGAIPLHAALFAIMTALWCFAGNLLVGNRFAGAMVRRWGHVACPSC